MNLTDYRTQIDCIDRQLVELFLRRMEICGEIADYKQKNGLPVLDAGREQEKLAAVCAGADPALQEALAELYRTIFRLSRDHQTRRMNSLPCAKGGGMAQP